MSKDTVIIVADKANCQAGCVAREIEQFFGGKAVMLDPSTVSKEFELTFEFSPGGALWFKLALDKSEVSHENLAGVWYAGYQCAEPDEPSLTGFESLRGCVLVREWLSCLRGIVVNPLASLLDVPPNFLAQQAAAYQLRFARILTTNARGEAEKFCETATGEVIATPLKRLPDLLSNSCKVDGELPSWFCEAGAVLQEEPEARQQVIATVIRHEIFCVSYPVLSLRCSPDDGWLDDMAAKTKAHKLPREVSNKLLQLARSMALTLCTFTLQINSAGEYTLREAHPRGRFLFAEIHGGLLISRALARLLLRPGPMEAAQPQA